MSLEIDRTIKDSSGVIKTIVRSLGDEKQLKNFDIIETVCDETFSSAITETEKCLLERQQDAYSLQ